MRILSYLLSVFKSPFIREPDEVLTFITMYYDTTEKELKSVKMRSKLLAEARRKYVLDLHSFTELSLDEIADRVNRPITYVKYVLKTQKRKS